MSDNLAVTIIVSTCACVLGWAIWAIAVNVRRGQASKQIADLHSRLLDRFAANQELITFLEGESGRRYFDALQADIHDPFSRILNGIQAGVVLLVLGVSLMAIRAGQDDQLTRNTLLLTGVPGIALGAGFLISSAISHRMCKSWGLFDKNRRQAP